MTEVIGMFRGGSKVRAGSHTGPARGCELLVFGECTNRAVAVVAAISTAHGDAATLSQRNRFQHAASSNVNHGSAGPLDDFSRLGAENAGGHASMAQALHFVLFGSPQLPR